MDCGSRYQIGVTPPVEKISITKPFWMRHQLTINPIVGDAAKTEGGYQSVNALSCQPYVRDLVATTSGHRLLVGSSDYFNNHPYQLYQIQPNDAEGRLLLDEYQTGHQGELDPLSSYLYLSPDGILTSMGLPQPVIIGPIGAFVAVSEDPVLQKLIQDQVQHLHELYQNQMEWLAQANQNSSCVARSIKTETDEVDLTVEDGQRLLEKALATNGLNLDTIHFRYEDLPSLANNNAATFTDLTDSGHSSVVVTPRMAEVLRRQDIDGDDNNHEVMRQVLIHEIAHHFQGSWPIQDIVFSMALFVFGIQKKAEIARNPVDRGLNEISLGFFLMDVDTIWFERTPSQEPLAVMVQRAESAARGVYSRDTESSTQAEHYMNDSLSNMQRLASPTFNEWATNLTAQQARHVASQLATELPDANLTFDFGDSVYSCYH